MEAQARRLRHTTENIANADTPGYRRKTTDFGGMPTALVSPGPVRLDQTDLRAFTIPAIRWPMKRPLRRLECRSGDRNR
jgi:flagellar basal-body rod protein FlgC